MDEFIEIASKSYTVPALRPDKVTPCDVACEVSSAEDVPYEVVVPYLTCPVLA